MFEDLENTLKDIKRELALYRKLFELIFDNLKTKTQVARYLKVHPSTINNWTKNGTFEEGIHFIIDENGKKEYIPNGIIEFEEALSKRKIEIKKVEKQFNPIASRFLNKVVFNG
jgi:intein-encoded DNA endonuclease-like protein